MHARPPRLLLLRLKCNFISGNSSIIRHLNLTKINKFGRLHIFTLKFVDYLSNNSF